jgi:hypothetical protein
LKWFLVTNEHVVRDAAQVRLVTGAGLISTRVVKVEAANDLALPENVNYAVKSWWGGRCRAALILGLRSTAALPFLESVPEVSAKLKEPITNEKKLDDVVRSAEQAAVLVLVY